MQPEAFVHLTYLDEAGTDGHSSIVMFGAVVVFPGVFGRLEMMHHNAIYQIFPDQEEVDRRFQEFHASELYLGAGSFAGIEERRRFDAINVLLIAMKVERLPYIYAAVDRKKLADSPLRSADPVDVAFNLCLLGVEDWARNRREPQQPNLLKIHLRRYVSVYCR